MKWFVLSLVAVTLWASAASAQCTKAIRRPQKAHSVARTEWTSNGLAWAVDLTWRTISVSDNGEEEAASVLTVTDRARNPNRGDYRVYHLNPNRCDMPTLPRVSTVKLMGRDFLLVTLPDTRGTGGEGLVVAWMYSLDEQGKLHQVFHGAYHGHYFRSAECRPFTKSEIRPVGGDGSRFNWIYEYPDVESVRKKSECRTAKRGREEHAWEWKNGCFALAPDQPRKGRLDTDWDDQCIPGVGMKAKDTPKSPPGPGERPSQRPADGGTLN